MIAVYSNVSDARQGGGLPYILAIGAALARDRDVRMVFPVPLDAGLVEKFFPIPAGRLRVESRPGPGSWSGELKAVLEGMASDGVLIQATEVPRLRGLRNAHLICEFPFQRELKTAERVRLALFRSVVANSAYTARWIERRWGRPARVLHPPIFPVTPGEKRPWIAAVGRFAGGGRSKRQIEMIETFRKLGLPGWELHLVGAAQDREYAQWAVEAAEGLPVVFHFDASREELERVLGSASLFWHFTGAGIDPEAEPERMEHFGISTAEAMSAGAVPVVIAQGGQPEILGEAGVLWTTFEECVAATRALCLDEERRVHLAERSRQRADVFAFPAFAERARSLFLN